jgi:PAS domain S-box-containing protein
MKSKILLVEDNPLDINFFKQVVEHAGFDMNGFQIAETLEGGLAILANSSPDIIFLDLTLSDSEGISTFHEMKKNARQIPIVILTGNEDEKMALDALRFGAQDYLLKKNISPLLISRSTLYAIERKRIEMELLKSKASNEALIENTNDGIWSVDRNMIITIKNSRITEVMEELCGKRPEVGNPVLDFLPQQFHKWYISLFERAMNGERFCEETNLHFNNQDRYLELSVNPIRSTEQTIVGVSFFARNINNRKNAEIKIKKSEEAYRLLLETINEGVMFIDNDNIIRFANRKFIETTGFLDNEITGNNFGNLLAENDSLQRKNIVAEILANEDPKEILIKSKNGQSVWFSVKGTPLMDENGQVGGTLLTHTEITDRKNAEQTIRKKEQDYSNLLETMNEGLVYLDKESAVKFANKKFEELTGFKVENLLGKKVPSQVMPETLLGLLSDEHSLPQTGNSNNYRYEIQITKNSAEQMWCMVSCSIIKDETGAFNGLLISYSDISDRKQTEDKLEVAQRELNTFIYRSSHDLKGPLSSILGLINILEKDDETSTHSPCIKMIRQSAEKLDRMLNEMLNVVRIKKEKIFPETIDFRSELSSIVQSLRSNDAFYSVKRNFDIENRKELHTDKKLLNLVLHNLIDNAIKYHSPEKDSFVTVRVIDYMHGVKIFVEDNGCGFKDSTSENIFNMFNKGNYKSEGNGLGLYVVKNAIDRLGGYIELSCEAGQNTLFTIFLPDLFSTNKWVGQVETLSNNTLKATV